MTQSRSFTESSLRGQLLGMGLDGNWAKIVCNHEPQISTMDQAVDYVLSQMGNGQTPESYKIIVPAAAAAAAPISSNSHNSSSLGSSIASSATSAPSTSIGSTGSAFRLALPPGTSSSSSSSSSSSTSSSQNNADAELATALSLSAAQAGVSASLSTSDEDKQLQQAISESIQLNAANREEFKFLEPENPHLRVREDGMPVGLKNVGNTCYFNSLAQLYFHLRPKLLQTVFSFPTNAIQMLSAAPATSSSSSSAASSSSSLSSTAAPPSSSTNSSSSSTVSDAKDSKGKETEKEKEKDKSKDLKLELQLSQNKACVTFVLDLQRLFAFLLLSQRRYFDPSTVISSLFTASGKKSDRQQHDVTEINEPFLENLRRAFDSVQHCPQFIRDTFEGQSVVELNGTNSSGQTELIQTTDKWIHQTVDVRFVSDLYSSLDHSSFHVEVPGYRLPSDGTISTVEKNVWVERFPPVLSFLLQRVQYEKNALVKLNTLFEFDEKIFVDRYLLKNREEATRRRHTLKQLNQRKSELSNRLERLKDYEGKKVALNDALSCVQHLLSIKIVQTEKNEHLKVAEQVVSQLHSEVDSEMKSLESALIQVKHDIAHVFDGLDSESYRLFAVFIHDGKDAASGHYWTYIKRVEDSKWFKFNDSQVTQMKREEESTIWAESKGGAEKKNASAYLLIYLSEKEISANPLPQDYLSTLLAQNVIPASLVKEVNDDNEKLRKECENWTIVQDNKIVDATVDKALHAFNKLDKTAREAADQKDFLFPALPDAPHLALLSRESAVKSIFSLYSDFRLRSYAAFALRYHRRQVADDDCLSEAWKYLKNERVDLVDRMKLEAAKKLIKKFPHLKSYFTIQDAKEQDSKESFSVPAQVSSVPEESKEKETKDVPLGQSHRDSKDSNETKETDLTLKSGNFSLPDNVRVESNLLLESFYDFHHCTEHFLYGVKLMLQNEYRMPFAYFWYALDKGRTAAEKALLFTDNQREELTRKDEIMFIIRLLIFLCIRDGRQLINQHAHDSPEYAKGLDYLLYAASYAVRCMRDDDPFLQHVRNDYVGIVEEKDAQNVSSSVPIDSSPFQKLLMVAIINQEELKDNIHAIQPPSYSFISYSEHDLISLFHRHQTLMSEVLKRFRVEILTVERLHGTFISENQSRIIMNANTNAQNETSKKSTTPSPIIAPQTNTNATLPPLGPRTVPATGDPNTPGPAGEA